VFNHAVFCGKCGGKGDEQNLLPIEGYFDETISLEALQCPHCSLTGWMSYGSRPQRSYDEYSSYAEYAEYAERYSEPVPYRVICVQDLNLPTRPAPASTPSVTVLIRTKKTRSSSWVDRADWHLSRCPTAPNSGLGLKFQRLQTRKARSFNDISS
jgi:hypothetical protein